MKSQKKTKISHLKHFLLKNYIPLSICLFFASAYLTLSISKHQNFMSGYDLSIIDQAIWKYSQFKDPVTTTHVYFDAPIYTDHLELIFILIAPLYWVFDSAITLIVLQVLAVIASGVGVFLLAKEYRLKPFVANILLINYFAFFGIQFAIWSDVHSLVFAVGFLAWFLLFLKRGNVKLTILFLVFSIICKEDIALLTLLLSLSFFILYKSKLALYTMVLSALYLGFVFLIYFPFIIGLYKYAPEGGIFSDPNPLYLINSVEKQKTILFSLANFGLLPLFSPTSLLAYVGDLGHYFILGNTKVESAQGLFGHYRSTLSLLLVWPTIIVISRLKKFNNLGVGIYLLICTLFFQYYLHLPLSYLSKSWFWKPTPEKESINYMIKRLPKNASVVTTNNIASHVTHRDEVYTLFPYFRDFEKDSPCGSKTCRWFRVGGNPQYLMVDVGDSWNILHYLAHRDEFFEAIKNLEINGNIKLIEQRQTTKLYKVVKKI